MNFDDDAPTRERPKKDRTRWCGGHVGRAHEWGAWKRYLGLKAYRQRVCERCGKKSPIKRRKDSH